jgi:hypothetical protein
MLTAKGFSDLPTVTPEAAEHMSDAGLQARHVDYRKDLINVAWLSEMLHLDRADEIDRLMESAARLHDEITTRRDTVRMLAQANAILQGIES